MVAEKNSILTALKSVVEYHKIIGVTTYSGESLDSFFSIVPDRQETSVATVSQNASLNSPATKKEPATTQHFTLGDIASEVEGCHACSLHQNRIYPVPGAGADAARLMIVGDWLSEQKSLEKGEKRIFGQEQDTMLQRMLAAISLRLEDVFITNVIKCGLSEEVTPLADHVKTCSSYLRRQIISLQPELICTMGSVAAKAVLDTSQPLSRLRGQFHNYTVSEQLQIPVLSTYHPTYLLQNPEMKRATWADIQGVAKKLGLLIKA